MKRIQSNIWSLFLLLTTVATIAFLGVLYFDYKHVTKKASFELEMNVELVANSIAYKFAEQELMLSYVGRELFRGQRTLLQQKQYLDELLKKYPAMAAFGLLDTHGNFIVTSSNVKVPVNANLLQNQSIKHFFNKSLDSKYMVIGKTVFFKPLGQWVIPIRKAIRDEDGKVLGVMAGGILNDTKENFMDQLHLLSKYNIAVIKGADHKGEYFRQYVSDYESASQEDAYNNPLSKQFVDKVKDILYKEYKLDIEQIENSKKIVTFEFLDAFGQEQHAGMVYNKEYDLWILLKQDYNKIASTILRSAAIYSTTFIAVFILLLWLFKRLAKSEIRSKNSLIYQAEHDELTRLPNRKYMYNHIKEWMQRHKEEFCVLYLDLDNFKNINDKFGHTVGDKILQEVAQRLLNFFTARDMIIRQGGDEFIIFLQDPSGYDLDNICKNLIKKISDIYLVEGNEFRIGMSIGLSSYPKDSHDINELLSFADTAMYKAKQHKNYYTFFSEEMRHENALRSDIEHELRAALKNGEIFLMYQPQVRSDGAFVGVEALARWKNKKLGFVAPDIFIEVAEQTGMMDDIGAYIIAKAAEEIKLLQDKLETHFSLSLNISVVQFMEDDFLEELIFIIEQKEFNKSSLILEVTESLSISDFDKIVHLLQSIREQGIEISLDDFGTGYSSLSILRKLPINELKIDKSFIDGIVYDENDRKLVRSIVEIAKNFDLNTVAEGVENQEQLQILQELGCELIQGYYYSKPLTIEQLEQYIKKGTH